MGASPAAAPRVREWPLVAGMAAGVALLIASAGVGGPGAATRVDPVTPPAAMGAMAASSPAPTRQNQVIPVTGNRAVAQVGGVRLSFTAPTHTPRAGARWPVVVTAGSGARALVAQVSLDVLYQGIVVGHMGSGTTQHGVYRFGTRWPAQSVGHPLTVKATITAPGMSELFTYDVAVR